MSMCSFGRMSVQGLNLIGIGEMYSKFWSKLFVGNFWVILRKQQLCGCASSQGRTEHIMCMNKQGCVLTQK